MQSGEYRNIPASIKREGDQSLFDRLYVILNRKRDLWTQDD